MNRTISNLEKQFMRETMKTHRMSSCEMVRHSDIDEKVERLVFAINPK